jgi:potassium efflux system protein
MNQNVSATLTALLILCAITLSASPQTSQSVEKPGQQVIEPLSADEILVHANSDEIFVQHVLDLAHEPDPSKDLANRIRHLSAGIQRLSESSSRYDLHSLPETSLRSLYGYWKFYSDQLAKWRNAVRQVTAPYSASAAGLAQRKAVWEATRAAAATANLPPALTDRIKVILSRIDEANRALSPQLNSQSKLARQGGSVQAQCDSARRAMSTAFTSFDRRLLRIDSPSFSEAWSERRSFNLAAATLANGFKIEKEFVEDYSAAYAWKHDLLAMLALIFLLLLLWISRSQWKPISHDLGDPMYVPVLQRPISSWLIIIFIIFVSLESDAPITLRKAALLLVLIPVLRLLPRRAYEVFGRWPVVAIALYLLYALGFLAFALPFFDRLHQLVMGTLAFVILLLFLQRIRRHTGTPYATTHVTAIRFVGSMFVAASFAGIVANIIGNVSLAHALTGGVIQSCYFALMLYAATAVLMAVLKLALAHPALAKSRAVTMHRETLLKSLRRLLSISALLAWVAITLKAFFVFRWITDFVSGFLSQPLVIGKISVTFGSIILFLVSIWVSFRLAKAIRFSLREEVLPKMDLPYGVGDSIATLTYYSLLTIGFMIALIISGFQLGQLTIAVGALGVGIGFGLQNIARDIVSGIVLLFERPVRVGDWVEVENLLGMVTQIGIRATRVRSRDGAEVVVPNGNLISGYVTNWTLSDRRHRVHVRAGVAYGTNPEKVLDILAKVAKSHPDVLTFPAPQAIFKGFGESSLDFELRVWTQNTERGWEAEIRSDLFVAISKAMAENGIEIPFPQRDLHLRSVSREARAGLNGIAPGRSPEENESDD